MPCADPWKRCSEMNNLKKGVNSDSNWKVVALGIGDELLLDDEYGWKQVKGCSYDPNKAKIVKWENLDEVVSDIVDISCNNNS